MSKSVNKILFIYQKEWSFVRTDLEILSAKYHLTRYQFKPVKGLIRTAFEMLKQILFLLFNIWKFDSVFIWFADYHSFLPVLFAKLTGKRSYVVIGGYDICRIKSLNYGVFITKFRGFFASQSMKMCTCNLTVSNYVDRKVKWIFPKAKTQLIYNSVRLANDVTEGKKKDIILTVGQIDNIQTFLRKGIDTFIEVAKLLPEYKFIVVGIDPGKFQHYLSNISDNIIFYQRVQQNELIKFYADAKIYAQFSRMDTFCLTLAEAMLFECIPVITNEGGMPEVAGTTGAIVKRDSDLISKVIRNKIVMCNSSKNAKDRIHENFTIDIREKKILKFFE